MVSLPKLEDTRTMGGLHPSDVLELMAILRLMWVPPVAAATLYIASFRLRKLNTAEAVAVTALSSTGLLTYILFWALFHISFW